MVLPLQRAQDTLNARVVVLGSPGCAKRRMRAIDQKMKVSMRTVCVEDDY
jgi:hypothetical protein